VLDAARGVDRDETTIDPPHPDDLSDARIVSLEPRQGALVGICVLALRVLDIEPTSFRLAGARATSLLAAGVVSQSLICRDRPQR